MLNVIKWLFEMLNAKFFRILDVNALSQLTLNEVKCLFMV